MDPKLVQRLERQRSKIDTGESDTQVWDGFGNSPSVNSSQPTSELAFHLEKQNAKILKPESPVKSPVKKAGSPAATDGSSPSQSWSQPDAELAKRLSKQNEKLFTGESAVSKVGSNWSREGPVDRVQGDLAMKLEQRRNRINTGEGSIAHVFSRAEPNDKVGSELASKLQKQQSKIDDDEKAQEEAPGVVEALDAAAEVPQDEQDDDEQEEVREEAPPVVPASPEEPQEEEEVQEEAPPVAPASPQEPEEEAEELQPQDQDETTPLAAARNKEARESAGLRKRGPAWTPPPSERTKAAPACNTEARQSRVH